MKSKQDFFIYILSPSRIFRIVPLFLPVLYKPQDELRDSTQGSWPCLTCTLMGFVYFEGFFFDEFFQHTIYVVYCSYHKLVSKALISPDGIYPY